MVNADLEELPLVVLANVVGGAADLAQLQADVGKANSFASCIKTANAKADAAASGVVASAQQNGASLDLLSAGVDVARTQQKDYAACLSEPNNSLLTKK